MLDVRACLEVLDTAEPACPSPVAVQSVLPSTRRTVSALRTRFTMLNALPTRAAVNASPTASRQPAHDSRRSMNWLLLCSKRLSLSVHSPVSLAVLLSPLIEPDVPISSIRLSDEIMPSPTESWPSATQGARGRGLPTASCLGSARISPTSPCASGTATGAAAWSHARPRRGTPDSPAPVGSSSPSRAALGSASPPPVPVPAVRIALASAH